jgi:hypothetical protein
MLRELRASSVVSVVIKVIIAKLTTESTEVFTKGHRVVVVLMKIYHPVLS